MILKIVLFALCGSAILGLLALVALKLEHLAIRQQNRAGGSGS
jgi:hypothetical protein